MDQLNSNEIMDYQISISVVYIDTKGIDVAESVLTYEHFFRSVHLCENQKWKTQCDFSIFLWLSLKGIGGGGFLVGLRRYWWQINIQLFLEMER